VYVTPKGGEEKKVFNLDITSKKEFNSWFYVNFGENVFVPKGAECTVEVQSSNVYQLIPFAHIKENIEKAKNREEFSEFKFELHESEEEEFEGEYNWNYKPLETDGDFLFCIKSLTVVPVDEKGFLDMQ